MMNIIWKRPDGGISVTHLTAECYHTPEQHAEFLQGRGDIPSDWLAVAFSEELPGDRDFRNAWSHIDGIGLFVDVEKARELTKERLRAEREPLLIENDKLFSIAMKTGAETDSILAERKRLLDVTDCVDAIKGDDESVLEQLKTLRVNG